MKRFRSILISGSFCLSLVLSLEAQEIIPLDVLVAEVLAQNLDIKIVKKNVDVAKLQASKAAAGQVPQININGGLTYQNNRTKFEFATEAFPPVDQKGAETWSYNAALNANYTLFDGYRGRYTFELLEKQVDLANLQTLLQAEGILIQVVNNYTNLISLQLQEQTIFQSIETSQERLRRTRLLVDFGQANQVDLLDAQVAINQDTALLIQVQNQASNLQRQINRLANWPADSNWQSQEALQLDESLQLMSLWETTLQNNIEYQIAQWNIDVSTVEIKRSEAAFYPLISLSAAYGYNRQDNQAGFLLSQSSLGPSGTLGVSMPVYDGKLRKQQLETSRIQKEISEMNEALLLQNLERDLNIAFANYQQALALWHLEEKNVLAADLNLKQNEAALAKGQSNSLLFRTAQLNWQRAEEQVIISKNQAKLAQLELMRISGRLLKPESSR